MKAGNGKLLCVALRGNRWKYEEETSGKFALSVLALSSYAAAYLDLLEHRTFSVGAKLRLASFERFDELVVRVINVAKPYGFIPEALLELLGLFVDCGVRLSLKCLLICLSSCYTRFELGAYPSRRHAFFRCDVVCDAVPVFSYLLCAVLFWFRIVRFYRC